MSENHGNCGTMTVIDQLEAEDYEGLDDLEEWKKEEQKVIDELIQRMQGAYNDV